MRIDSSGRVALRATSDPSTTSNYAHIYSKDVSNSAKCLLEMRTVMLLKSLHTTLKVNGSIFPEKNTKTGKVVRVNMEKMIRKLEEITGESFMEEWYEDLE